MKNLQVSALYIYPVKSLKGIKLTSSAITATGLSFDRKWMLIDEQGTFVSQRKFHQMALLAVEIDHSEQQLYIYNSTNKTDRIAFGWDEHFGEAISVTVWDDTCSAYEVNKEVSEWLSNYLGFAVRLVLMPDHEKREVDPRYAANGEIVSFADGYPCLLIGEASLAALNKKLEAPIQMDRFRPNIVFTGGEPHLEDSIGSFSINNIQFRAVKPCARCVLITVDQQTGVKGVEPLKALAAYRSRNKKIMFGQNLLHEGEGSLSIGDRLLVTSWKDPV